MEMQTFKIQRTVDSDIINNIYNKVNSIVEDHEVRLTPSEHKLLASEYVEKYVKNVDLSALLQISDNIINQKKLK